MTSQLLPSDLETWEDLWKRLVEDELREIPLDVENPPTTSNNGEQVARVKLIEKYEDPENNPEGKNSAHLMNALAKWEFENMPGMVLLVHGGHHHPLQLVRGASGVQRAEFLKSRPRFNHSYFDGQRDMSEGWMTAWNQWRQPTFHVSEKFATAEFTFKPPHTLFIDAQLQAQDDADLIIPGDRTKYEIIMDAVTHQPVARQAAYKGTDGVFYWDLSMGSKADVLGLVEGTASGVGDLRLNYIEWFEGMAPDVGPNGEPDPKGRLTKSKGQAKYLIGVTRPKNKERWKKMVLGLIANEETVKQKSKDSELLPGEIFIELRSLKLSKAGMARLGVLAPSAAGGDGMVLLKLDIPGDSQEVTDVFKITRGLWKHLPEPYQKRSQHEGTRSDELFDILTSPDPEKSDVIISAVLCNKNGAEQTKIDKDGHTVSAGDIGVAKLCLKDMIREEKPINGNGTYEINGLLELAGIVGLPLKDPSATPNAPGGGGAKGKKKPSRANSRDSMADSKPDSPAATSEDPEEPLTDPDEKPVSLGDVRVRIAIRPPTAKAGSGGVGGDSGAGVGTGDAKAQDPDLPPDMLSLAKIALRKRSVLEAARGEVADIEVGQMEDTSSPGLKDAPEAIGVPFDGAGSKPGSKPGSGMATPRVVQADMQQPEGGPPGPPPAGAPLPPNADLTSVTKLLAPSTTKDTVMYTFAYWIKWKPIDAISDQMLFFGDVRNQPALIRGAKLGALVENTFCSTEYDPRLAGDNWQLLVITNDGTYSKFYIGFSSLDDSGSPVPARSMEPEPNRDPGDVRTEFDRSIFIKKNNTVNKGAGLLAQAWIWPRDLQPDEVRELWLETKRRYPVAKRGLPSGGWGTATLTGYRAPPVLKGMKGSTKGQMSAKREDEKEPEVAAPAAVKRGKGAERELLPWEKYDPIIEKDTAAMLEIPLAAKLAFQRLVNVFAVLVDYAKSSESWLVVDRIHNMSTTAELMLEVALRRNPTLPPTVLVIDCKKRLMEATKKLKQLQKCGFLYDEKKKWGEDQKLFSHEFAMGSDLTRLVTPNGLAWLRASTGQLRNIESMIAPLADEVHKIYIEHHDEQELHPIDGRPQLALIWKNFYQAQLFASGTHYIVFDEVEAKGRPLIGTLGTAGSIFLNGDTSTYKKIIASIEDGAPLLLLESTGGVTQAFAYVMKAVRLMRKTWDIDFVMRLVTEYKARAARDTSKTTNSVVQHRAKVQQEVNSKYLLPNIQLLDKQLARIDVQLSTDTNELWMANFGLPEILMLFEMWQRAPDFLLRQVQTADVMKQSAEDLLDLFTGCFSSASSIPELGLGSAEIKVVATAWNRHLLLYNNARIYNYRSWIMQFLLYYLGFMTTTLSIFTTSFSDVGSVVELKHVMLILPILTALLGTVSTRLRIGQKYSVCKMASYEIVSEIYKFRVRAMEYDATALSAALAAEKDAGKDKKKKDEGGLEVPIPASEKDKLARRMFVTRVTKIYTECMNGEMSKGTSITHTARFGMDPARLLRGDDAGPDESEKETRRQLQMHVAKRLYFLTVPEWSRGVDAIKAERLENQEKNSRALKNSIKRHAKKISMLAALIAFKMLELSIVISAAVYGKAMSRMKGAIDQAAAAAGPAPAAKGPTTVATEDEETDAPVSDGRTPVERRLADLKQRWSKYWDVSGAVDSMVDQLTDGEKEGTGVRTLDPQHNLGEDEEDDPDAGAASAGGAAASGGGSKRIGDDFFSSLPIDAYMKYRAKPVLAYLERTAPWRGFWMQVLEIAIFTFSAAGAALVGLGDTLIPFVAMTVAVAGILRSFLEFSNLPKQVDSYNLAINMIHNMINDYDGLTRTQRRTPRTMNKVVGAVENAMSLVAVALTDALPGGQDDEEENGEEEQKDG